VRVLSPGDLPWVVLDPGDRMVRKTKWIRQIIVHTTKGTFPQHVKPGAGPAGKGQVVADFWRKDPNHSAAQIVIDNNGDIYCLCDLVKYAAYHATTANDMSIGIEIYQMNDGGIYEAALVACVKLVRTLCRVLRIPYQGPRRIYNNQPLLRMISGLPGRRGEDCVGVFGHRDLAWDYKKLTSTRGRGDPGDIIFEMLFKDGMAGWDYNARADIAFWKGVQAAVNLVRLAIGGQAIKIDGICGHDTYDAAMTANLWLA
jgi:hypothetical protein